MKRHIQIFAAVLAMMSAAGCSGMLDDIAPRHAISSDKLSDSDLNQLTNGMLNIIHQGPVVHGRLPRREFQGRSGSCPEDRLVERSGPVHIRPCRDGVERLLHQAALCQRTDRGCAEIGQPRVRDCHGCLRHILFLQGVHISQPCGKVRQCTDNKGYDKRCHRHFSGERCMAVRT